MTIGRIPLLFCFLGFIITLVLAVDPPLPGGPIDAPINSELNALSWRAVNEGVNKDSKETVHLAPIRIIKAKSQVVAGVLYHLEVLVGESTCEKKTVSHDQFSSSRCPVKSGNTKKQVCNFDVWQKPWEHFEEVTNKGCKAYTGTK